MNRRKFMQILGLTPVLGLLGCKRDVDGDEVFPDSPLIEGEFGHLNGIEWRTTMTARVINDRLVLGAWSTPINA